MSYNYGEDGELTLWGSNSTIKKVGKKFYLLDETNDPVYTFDSRGLTAESTIRRIEEYTGVARFHVQKALAEISMVEATRREIDKLKKVPKKKEPENFDQGVYDKAEKVLKQGLQFKYILDTVHMVHAGDDAGIVVDWLSALSGKLTKIKIHVWAIGKSGAGKSSGKYAVIMVLPHELYEVFTSASPLSLFYYVKKYGEHSLDGVLIFIDEVEAAKYTLPMLRSLTSQTAIEPRHLSVNDQELIDMVIRGSRSVWFTSVKPFGTVQIRNRFVFTNPDESDEQDDRVFDLQDKNYREKSTILREPFQVCKALAQLIVKETAELDVVIPYGIDWKFKNRRWLYPIFLAFIKVVAKTFYRRRPRTEDGKLVATLEDFEYAKGLWRAFDKSIIYRVTTQAIEVLNAIPEDQEDAKTHSELTDLVSFSTRWIEKLCEDLLDEGLVNRQKREREGPGRHAWEYWKSHIPTIEDVNIVLDRDLSEFTNLRTPAGENISDISSVTVVPKFVNSIQLATCGTCAFFHTQECIKENPYWVTQVATYPKSCHKYKRKEEVDE